MGEDQIKKKCFQLGKESIQDIVESLKNMMTFWAFPSDTLNENLFEQFLWGLKNENIESKLITQVDDLNFVKVVEKATVLHNANIDILE